MTLFKIVALIITLAASVVHGDVCRNNHVKYTGWYSRYRGDGYCDDKFNNLSCEWDGGDCCYKTVRTGKVMTDYCTEVGRLLYVGEPRPPSH